MAAAQSIRLTQMLTEKLFKKAAKSIAFVNSRTKYMYEYAQMFYPKTMLYRFPQKIIA